MGLATLIRKTKLKEREMRILILGLDNAGKSTIVARWLNLPVDFVAPTFGFEIKTLPYPPYTLDLWDIGGQKSIRAYWRNYFEETDGLVWVLDSSDHRRLSLCAAALHEVLSTDRLLGASLLILANKQDVEDALSIDAIGEALRIGELEAAHQVKVVRASAITGEGVNEGLDWLVGSIAGRMIHHD